jgi:Putative glucoamylase/Protein of unknown function (DUF3131)
MNRSRRILTIPLALTLLVAVSLPVAGRDKGTERTLEGYARDTWASFVAMTDPATGLPSDNIGGNLDLATRARYTSPTNIGMYIWATLAASDLKFIKEKEARSRIAQTLTSVAALERHEPSGQFWNWYDPATLQTITVWPEPPHNPVTPFASSVDNGWLASALLMVANGGVPQLRGQARGLLESMNFGCYYDPNAKADVGLIRGGFWLTPQGGSVPGDYCGMGEQVQYTGHHYGAFNTEPRIASYIGIAMGDIPAEHYFGGWRTFPDTCDWSWPETRPIGEWREYLGVDVFEGAYQYDDQLVVPTWGGSMFEALMVPLVVPEEEWGPTSWGVTHPLYVESQIEFGLEEAGYGYWGFSPSSHPAGGYREFGVDAIGMDTGTPDGGGYPADTQRLTLADAGWDDPNDVCDRAPNPIDDYGEGVVTPHAVFLALDFAPDATLANVANLLADFPELYGPGGFKDAVNVATGQIADRYLSLDQGMVIAAIANELKKDRLQRYFSRGEVEAALAPLMRMEQFGAGRVAP